LKTFVCLGTQDKTFNRLLEVIEKSDLSDEIIVQAGFTKFNSSKMDIKEYLNPSEFEKYMEEANLIITHGGVGTILKALNKNKKIIACARLAKYKEHQNDHQKEIIDKFEEEGYLLQLNENQNLNELLKQIEDFKPKKYLSNQENFLRQVKEYLNKTL